MNDGKLLDYCIFSENDKFCSLKSDKYNGFCDKHQNYLNCIEEYKLKEMDLCCNIIKEQFVIIDDTYGYNNKSKAISNLFDFLCKHKGFCNSDKGFADIILKKLQIFNADKKASASINTQKYLKELFPIYYIENELNDELDNIDLFMIYI